MYDGCNEVLCVFKKTPRIHDDYNQSYGVIPPEVAQNRVKSLVQSRADWDCRSGD